MYWLTGILGLALGGAPFVLGYSDNAVAMWTSVVLGAVVVVLSAIEAMDTGRQTWEYWGAGAAGLLAVIAPFAFGFSAITWALWVTVGFGFLILLISGYEVFTVETTTR
jgi:bacteriorhodopsin